MYKDNNGTFGHAQTPIIKMAADIFENKNPDSRGIFLDLGCGQGRDSLYMARRHFSVEAVDSSNVACDQLITSANENNLDIIVIVKNIALESYKIESSKYSIISAINVLHFLDKGSIFRIVEMIKSGLLSGGLAVISIFINEKGLQKQELLKLFVDFEIVYYIETTIEDKGHPGEPSKHKHQVARIVALKR